MRAAETRELRSTIAEGSVSGGSEVAVVGEPLNAANTAGNGRIKDPWQATVAIGACATAEGSGVVRCTVYGQWPAGAPGNDGRYLPTTDHGVNYPVQVMTKSLAAANRKFIDGIGSEDVGGVVVARRPFGLGIINVLPVGGRAECIVPCSVVSGAVGHALRVGVRHLVLQALAHFLLEDRLQRVVGHGSVGLRSGSRGTHTIVRRISQDAIERWVGGKERARAGSAVRVQESLGIIKRHHQMISLLADVAELHGGIARELVLNGQVPLIIDGRLNVGI